MMRQTGSTKRVVDVSKLVDVDEEEKLLASISMLTNWAGEKLRLAFLRLALTVDPNWPVTPTDFFKLLDVPHNAFLLCNPLVSAVETYLERYNREHAQSETLYSVLAPSVDEKVLVASIARAKAVGAYRERGEEVERALVERWAMDNQALPHVLKILELRDQGYRVYDHVKLLEKYINLMNEQKTQEQIPLDLFTVLEESLKDGPLALVLTKEMGLESIPDERYERYENHLNALFARWEDAELDPILVKSKYFENVPDELQDDVERIVRRYRYFYLGRFESSFYDPRRS
ncbi:hypothetical protein PsorP6_015835 [Peronosclerospora sorghi]|uniref:Uncharacterized protein n=1 Tax=Peronosclerospora sorghi TaxID=230839 RepID=A0ACC0WPZ2_9STRA|nr:hypothetical protein PsorP6_015835 [Peronosclerospora sorghi]